MKHKYSNIDPDAIEVLSRSTITENSLVLPPDRLPRALYEKVNKALDAAGGKWNSSAQTHLFKTDPRQALGLAIETGQILNEQQSFQSFYTPGPVASQMMEHADLCAGMTMLEPSAGSGNLIRAAMSHGIFSGNIVAVEIDQRKTELAGLVSQVHYKDFLQCNGDLGKFDRVLMNPPFTRGQDVAHIRHAIKFLEPGGRLVAICANSEKSSKALKHLALEWINLGSGAFKDSGTEVNTAMVVIGKL